LTVGAWAPLDPRVRAWWLFLCAAAAVNACAWPISARLLGRRIARVAELSHRRWQLTLSGVYALVCGFRGVFPRADVQRICLYDSWISSVALGRTVATIAELACALQWSLLAREFGRASGSSFVRALGVALVPLIVFAEVCSWYAVLTTNYLGNAIEESCWTLMAALLGVAMVVLARRAAPRLRRLLTVGVGGAIVYFGFMSTVDVPMYVGRWRRDQAEGRAYLRVADGWRDLTRRWVVTGSWKEWRTEMAWMGLYFSASVWAMMSLAHAPRFAAAPTRAP
jgi:hypothetical protein